MRGLSSTNLLTLVDFLYRGEANVLQEDVDAFLSIVKDLWVKGLMEPTEKVENKFLHPERSTNKTLNDVQAESSQCHPEKPRDKFVENVQEKPFSNAFDKFAKSYPERPMNNDVPVQTETHQVKPDVKSGDGVQKLPSSKPSPLKPNSKKELELAKQSQKENHYEGFTN